MRFSPFLTWFACLFVLTTTLSACASGVPSAPAASEPVTITIAYNGFFEQTFGPGAPPIEAIQAAVAERYPDLQVELQLMPYEVGPWRDNYLVWFQAGEGSADILGVGIYWLAEFSENGWLLPLDDRIDPAIVDKLNPAHVAAFTYDDNLMALGPWWGGIGGLYYRQDLLQRYNFAPPQDYESLVDIARTIQADQPDLAGWTWPALKDQALVNRWTEFLAGFGGQYFDDAGQCALNDAAGVAALAFMHDLLETDVTPRAALSWKEEESQVAFTSGRAIFHTGRQDMTFWLNDPEQSQVVEQWGFVPLPAAPAGRPAGFFEGWGFGISRDSRHPEAAAQVLEVMFDFAVQKEFNLSQGPLQAHVDVYTDPDVIANNPYMPLIEVVADTAVPPVLSPNYASISAILQEELHAALSDLKSPQAALDDACRQINALP